MVSHCVLDIGESWSGVGAFCLFVVWNGRDWAGNFEETTCRACPRSIANDVACNANIIRSKFDITLDQEFQHGAPPIPPPFPIHHNLLDIYKNRPRVIEHEERPNDEMWIGTEMQVLVAGNWTTYKSRVVQYLQQLAIITPYARLEMSYTNRSDERKGMNLRFERRSEQMPAQAREVKSHPSSVSFTYLRPSCRCCFFIFRIVQIHLMVRTFLSRLFTYSSPPPS